MSSIYTISAINTVVPGPFTVESITWDGSTDDAHACLVVDTVTGRVLYDGVRGAVARSRRTFTPAGGWACAGLVALRLGSGTVTVVTTP